MYASSRITKQSNYDLSENLAEAGAPFSSRYLSSSVAAFSRSKAVLAAIFSDILCTQYRTDDSMVFGRTKQNQGNRAAPVQPAAAKGLHFRWIIRLAPATLGMSGLSKKFAGRCYDVPDRLRYPVPGHHGGTEGQQVATSIGAILTQLGLTDSKRKTKLHSGTLDRQTHVLSLSLDLQNHETKGHSDNEGTSCTRIE